MQVVLFPPRTQDPELRSALPRERDVIAERVASALRVRRKRRLLRYGLGALRRFLRARPTTRAMSARQRAEEPLVQRSLT